ncbi:hypothetical protein EDD86DRAFT_74333 [Gorgonomyces haynaldii]|nr:hypothetical protein EDD86DRAFT_74333 [Gorgonomyces haynaldii]
MATRLLKKALKTRNVFLLQEAVHTLKKQDFGDALIGMSKLGTLQQVLDLHNKFKHKTEPDCKVLHGLVNAHCKRGEIDKAFEWIQKFKALNVTLDQFGQQALLNAICSSKQPMQLAEQVYESMDKTSHTKHTMLKGYLKRLDYTNADKMLKQITPDKFTLSLLREHAFVHLESNLFQTVFQKEPDQEIPELESLASQTMLVKHWIAKGEIVRANEYIKTMKTKDTAFYTNIVKSYIAIEDYESAHELVDEFFQLEMIPDVHFFHELLKLSLYRKSYFDQTYHIFKQMRRLKIAPDDQVYQLMMTAAAKRRSPKWMNKFLAHILELKHTLTPGTYHFMILALIHPSFATRDHLTVVLRLLDHMLTNNILPSPDDIQKIVDMCQRDPTVDSKLKLAATLLKYHKLDLFDHIITVFSTLPLELGFLKRIPRLEVSLADPDSRLYQLMSQMIVSLGQQQKLEQLEALGKMIDFSHPIHPQLIGLYIESMGITLNALEKTKRLWSIITRSGRPSIPKVTQEMVISYCRCLLHWEMHREAVQLVTADTVELGVSFDSQFTNEIPNLFSGDPLDLITQFWRSKAVVIPRKSCEIK